MNDFKFIAISKGGIAIGRFRHDFEIAFHRDLGRRDPEFAEKIGNGCCGIDGAVFTVDGQAHLFVLSLWYQNIHLLARSMRSCRARGKL